MSSFRELGSVEDTALDAANAKLSAVLKGYYHDRYIEYFVPTQVKQLPPMNLGYHVRTLAIHKAVTKFHELHGDNMQVVILGCGYDTLLWRLRDEKINIKNWFDIDFPHVTKKKAEVIKDNEMFYPLDNYHLITCDLSKFDEFKKTLGDNGFEDIPTIFVDECSLIYVDPDPVDEIISFAGHMKSSAFISYGMVRPDDQFGKMMVINFERLGSPLKGIAKYPTIDSHRVRFENGGFAHVKSVDLNATMRAVIPRPDYIKIMRLEIQDDPEELAYMLSHYVLAIAGSDEGFLSILSMK